MTEWIQLRENRQRVRHALRQGVIDEIMACRATAFDELVGAMHTFGYWDQLEEIKIALEKDADDVPNKLLKRELAVLPLLRIPNPYQAPTYLFKDEGVLRFLGFTLSEIREGFNTKGVRSPSGTARMRPHHRDTLYNALKAVDLESLADFRDAHRQALIREQLLSGGIFGIDGTGLRNSDRHVVILQQVGGAIPFIANWRVQGPGQELAAGREMVAELQAELGPEAIKWLLLDGAYVDGAWLAKLQQQGIGAMVRVYQEMDIFEHMLELTAVPAYQFEPYEYVRTIQGHKELHRVELALIPDLTLWTSYQAAWQTMSEESGTSCPGLTGLLVREQRVTERGARQEITWGLVFTRPFTSRKAAFEQWRSRWGVENQGFRELNQGGWLESQTWGRSEAAVQTSIALKIGAHNCYCLMRTELGAAWAVTGLRDLQHQLFGSPPQFMVVVDDMYALFSADEFATCLGVKIQALADMARAEVPT
jgi:hypothetical protein